MEFYINDWKWEITEATEEKIISELNDSQITAAFGLCDYHKHIILINKDMCEDQKEQTLTHELVHCYLWSLGIRFEEYPEEAVCDMFYSMMLFIGRVLDEWRNGRNEQLVDSRRN